MSSFKCSCCGWCCKNFTFKQSTPDANDEKNDICKSNEEGIKNNTSKCELTSVDTKGDMRRGPLIRGSEDGCKNRPLKLNPGRSCGFPINEYDLKRLRESDLFEESSVEPSAGFYDHKSKKVLIVAWTFRDSRCPYYIEKEGCSIYSHRPAVCRAYPLTGISLDKLRPEVGHCPSIKPEHIEFIPTGLNSEKEFLVFMRTIWNEQVDEFYFGRGFFERTIAITEELDAKGLIEFEKITDFAYGNGNIKEPDNQKRMGNIEKAHNMDTSECIGLYEYAEKAGLLPKDFLGDLVEGRYGKIC